MRLIRRVALLLLLSVSGIALIAPLAARSAAVLPRPGVDRLLPAVSRAPVNIDRSFLSSRATNASSISGRAEALGAEPIPTPASVGMEPTIVTIAAPAPAPAQAVAAAPVPPVPADSVWDALAQCESSGNWAINTGNGYYGGLQFDLATWQQYGGTEYAAYPHQATREQQIAVAERLHAARGFAPWPACRVELGLP